MLTKPSNIKFVYSGHVAMSLSNLPHYPAFFTVFGKLMNIQAMMWHGIMKSLAGEDTYFQVSY